MKEFRKIAMEETQKAIAKELENIPKFIDPKLNYVVTSFFKKKVKSISVRSYFLRYMYLYIIELSKKEKIKLRAIKKEHFTVHLPFLADLTMSIMYLDNHNLDMKYGTSQQLDFSNNQFGSYSLRKILRDYVQKQFNKKNANLIQNSLSQLFESVNIGQFLDKNYNNYEGYIKNQGFSGTYKEVDNLVAFGGAKDIIEEIKKEYPNKANYINLYFTRIFLTTASFFFLFTKLLLEMLGYSGKQKKAILDFSIAHGLMRQIVNDNTDFVKHRLGTVAKYEEDAFSDLRNQTITLPLIFHLSECDNNSVVKNYLETQKKDLIIANDFNILDELILSDALPNSMRKCRQICSSKGYRPLLQGDNPIEEYLNNLSSIAFNNRFYHVIYLRRKYLSKTKCSKNSDNSILVSPISSI